MTQSANPIRFEQLEEVVLAEPRGFCAGVERAIEIVERALERFGAPIYVRHEIVHNDHVVSDLRQKGAIFVDDLDEVPVGARVIMSAHGVSRRFAITHKRGIWKYLMQLVRSSPRSMSRFVSFAQMGMRS